MKMQYFFLVTCIFLISNLSAIGDEIRTAAEKLISTQCWDQLIALIEKNSTVPVNDWLNFLNTHLEQLEKKDAGHCSFASRLLFRVVKSGDVESTQKELLAGMFSALMGKGTGVVLTRTMQLDAQDIDNLDLGRGDKPHRTYYEKLKNSGRWKLSTRSKYGIGGTVIFVVAAGLAGFGYWVYTKRHAQDQTEVSDAPVEQQDPGFSDQVIGDQGQ